MAVTMEIERDEDMYKIEVYINYLGEFDYDVLTGPTNLELDNDEIIYASEKAWDDHNSFRKSLI